VKILYSAIDQTVPGTKGGSVHVTAVAEGLAALGHEVQVLVTPGDSFRLKAEATELRDGRKAEATGSVGSVRWIAMPPPFGRKELRWTRTGQVRRVAEAFRPDVVMERYYNFGGEAIAAAAAVGATAVLEVNAPVIDHEGSAKQLVDRILLVEPMRRWRERICRLADLIVTPSAAILPPGTPDAKVVEIEWGADTDQFRPDPAIRAAIDRSAATVAIFAGAFRAWHGAVHLATAIRTLQAKGRFDIGAMFVGDGPELPRVREAAAGLSGVTFTGAVPHERMPEHLARADIGAAPFDVAAHRPLTLGFYWSPLKVFEYMAAGLPVVAPALDRLASIVAHEREGLLYEPGDPGALAAALERLADPALRAELGRAARERAVREYSWKAHCLALDAGIRAVRSKR
jgi:glycosyltransferase involved in cell wall biosynthesis